MTTTEINTTTTTTVKRYVVTGAEPVRVEYANRNRQFVPNEAVITVRDGRLVDATLYGGLLRKDGTPSTEVIHDRTYFAGYSLERDAPEWLRDLANEALLAVVGGTE